MRFPTKKVSPRATALALAFGVVGVLVTAVPASAVQPTVSSVTPHPGHAATVVIVTGTSFTAGARRPKSLPRGRRRQLVQYPHRHVADGEIPRACTTGAGSAAPYWIRTRNADTAGELHGAAAAQLRRSHRSRRRSGPVGTSVVITGTNLCGRLGLVQRHRGDQRHSELGDIRDRCGAGGCHDRSDPCDDGGLRASEQRHQLHRWRRHPRSRRSRRRAVRWVRVSSSPGRTSPARRRSGSTASPPPSRPSLPRR